MCRERRGFWDGNVASRSMRHAAHAYSCPGGPDFLRMVFALVHVQANLLVGDAGSRHALSPYS